MAEEENLIPTRSTAETALDVASVVTSAVPWIGGPISNVLSGASFGRKLERVRETLYGLVEDLRNLKSEVSEQYVKTEDFQELLEQILHRVADERSQEKRRIYREYLAGAVKSPGERYDEQIRFLRTLEQLQSDHISVIRAILQNPDPSQAGAIGSPIQTFRERLPDMEEARIRDMVDQLNAMGLTSFASLNTVMTGSGAEALGHSLTPYGRRFTSFLQS